MIAEAGLAALWLAAALSLLQLLLGVRLLRGGVDGGAGCSCRSRSLQGLLTLLSFAAADCGVPAHRPVRRLGRGQQPQRQAVDLQIRRSVGQSRRLDAAVGDACWPLAGAAIALFERRLTSERWARPWARRRRSALGFFAFLLFASNPFERLDPAPLEGRGLNPLLQDPGLAFHPPTLYLGYVGLSVAFSLAVGGAPDPAMSARRSPGRCGPGCLLPGSC